MRRDRSRLSLVGEPDLGPDEYRKQCDWQSDQRCSDEKRGEACALTRSAHRAGFSVRSGHCWPPPYRCANNAQARKQRDSNLSDQPFVTMGGGALPLPMPTQPATLTATRVATKAMSTFFIGVPLSSRHAMHTSCLAAPLVVRCPQWFTAPVDSGALRRGLCPWRHSLGARYSFAACFSTGSSARRRAG